MSDRAEIKPDLSYRLIGSDSRLKQNREAKQVQDRFGGWWDPAFCMNCGKPQGFIWRDTWACYVQCDDCFEKFGEPGGCLARLPEEDEVKYWNKRRGYSE